MHPRVNSRIRHAPTVTHTTRQRIKTITEFGEEDGRGMALDELNSDERSVII